MWSHLMVHLASATGFYTQRHPLQFGLALTGAGRVPAWSASLAEDWPLAVCRSGFEAQQLPEAKQHPAAQLLVRERGTGSTSLSSGRCQELHRPSHCHPTTSMWCHRRLRSSNHSWELRWATVLFCSALILEGALHRGLPNDWASMGWRGGCCKGLKGQYITAEVTFVHTRGSISGTLST